MRVECLERVFASNSWRLNWLQCDVAGAPEHVEVVEHNSNTHPSPPSAHANHADEDDSANKLCAYCGHSDSDSHLFSKLIMTKCLLAKTYLSMAYFYMQSASEEYIG